jgi:uncharacterized membrane protein
MEWQFNPVLALVVVVLLTVNFWVMAKGLVPPSEARSKNGRKVQCFGVIVFILGFILWCLGARKVGGDTASHPLISAGTAVVVTALSVTVRGRAMTKEDEAQTRNTVVLCGKVMFGLAIALLVGLVVVGCVWWGWLK